MKQEPLFSSAPAPTPTRHDPPAITGLDGKAYPPRPAPPPPDPQAKRLADEKQARSDLYSGIAKAVMVLDGYAGYGDITELMNGYDPGELSPPQLVRYLDISALESAWAELEYDRIVDELGKREEFSDGVPIKEITSEFQRRYVIALRERTVIKPPADEWRDGLELFGRVVRPVRDGRSRKLIDHMRTIQAALNDETILGREDPILHQAHRLGTLDGRDKIIGLWSVEDWRNLAMTRYRLAAEATAAAAELDEAQQAITAAMTRRGAITTWDLFPPE